jgi:hypothetical protein
VVEPVFGQIKQARGFRQFLLRGVEKVRAEWAMICTAHNLTIRLCANPAGHPRRVLRCSASLTTLPKTSILRRKVASFCREMRFSL